MNDFFGGGFSWRNFFERFFWMNSLIALLKSAKLFESERD